MDEELGRLGAQARRGGGEEGEQPAADPQATPVLRSSTDSQSLEALQGGWGQQGPQAEEGIPHTAVDVVCVHVGHRDGEHVLVGVIIVIVVI